MKTPNFPKVDPKQSFPKLEENILDFWKQNEIFEESITSREGSEEFSFYDGPPFATGTPHYGHILAGTIKDVIPRYQTMLGKKVDRKFGWDCHGLPIENIVEKKLEISGKDDIEKIGIHTFNETCRENVFGYVEEWKKTVERMGRWVDIDNSYKTMDKDFMQSVWSVFKNIYDKGLIYEGHRVVPYCPRCTTPLSNFEVNQGYKDKQSKTATVKFKVKGTENKYILAWTTTPWTLLANLGLAVGEDILYSEILDTKTGDTYILASNKISSYYKEEESYKIIREYKGACLVGIEYEAIFDDFSLQLTEMKSDLGTGIELGINSFKVVLGHHVTTETGTGVVHIAPAFGEDDNIIGKEQKLGFVSHIDDSGKTYNLLDNNGLGVFEFNEKVLETLKKEGKIIKIDTITHSYPHCWRCDTPLIYRAISAWYVAVEQIKERMLKNNDKINWTPDIIKHGRFGKWLEGAKDWNISRNRYWGSAIPVWQSEDKKEEVCVGSIEELYQLNKDFGDITKVIFVRHGRTDYNEKGLLDYKGKANLTEVGKNQAIEIKEKLKDLKIDAIFSSPLSRCQDTISPLANKKGLEINIIDDFIEINSPDLQDKEFSCKNYKWDNGYGGGEKISEAYYRVTKAFKKIIEENKGKTIVICSHGDPVFLMRQLMTGVDYDTQKYTSGLYLENNPKYGIEKIFAVDYVYSKTYKQIDLHKHFVDELLVKNPKTGNSLKRIPEVLDCWFESGAMPYASKGLVFENEKNLGDNFKFPADFIAEGLDQTRGWFYTLLILGTALFDNTPFLNVIVNGIVLAEDGKKMSKSLKNYPDPKHIFDKYGADAMRFYLMNSPVVEAQDLRFSEAGVEEVVKKVILPLWNTYSFFTTYANIDNFEPKKGRLYFVRHGETENNIKGIVNGAEEDGELNENGISQANKAGNKFKINGMKLDKVYLSPRKRTRETAEIIISKLGYDVEVIEDERINEVYFGKFKGMTHDEIKNKYNLNSDYELRVLYREQNGVENIDEFNKRVNNFYKEIENEIKSGKNILIVSHNGVFRAINQYINNLSKEFANFECPICDNGVIFKLPNYNKSNNLDKWIISELHTLIKNVSEGLNTYKINEATKYIVEFMDNLTNWYIRRSRKRFWKSENDNDKIEAYNTLYEVLVELTKIISVFMPFVSEHIYKNLTGNKSVHLDIFPENITGFINESLNKDMDKTQKIINLGLAWRANNKIRVRQPLNSITIGEKLSSYYEEIIKEELNVKEVIVIDSSKIAKKVCKPNGRNIGPKFGGDVKFIMSEAKSGNFEELSNGDVKVGEFVLENGDFEIVFEVGDSKYNIEAGFGMVIAMDSEITKELKLEGFARDIVRQIQESRKEANYNVDDRISINISGNNDEISEIISNFGEYIETETLSKINSELNSGDIEKEVNLEEYIVKIVLKK